MENKARLKTVWVLVRIELGQDRSEGALSCKSRLVWTAETIA